MPFEPDRGPDAPVGTHLGLMVKDGTMIAIPRGAQMAIITDPERVDGVLPLVLVAVSNNTLKFRCACSNPKCTQVLTFKATRTGFHPRMGSR